MFPALLRLLRSQTRLTLLLPAPQRPLLMPPILLQFLRAQLLLAPPQLPARSQEPPRRSRPLRERQLPSPRSRRLPPAPALRVLSPSAPRLPRPQPPALPPCP